MQPYNKKGALIAEGKTKKIYAVEGQPGLAIIEYKNDITAFDNPAFTKQFDKKAEYSNTTNAGVFELLKNAGLPVAFKHKISATEFLSESCTMIPLEVVARRYAVGSYLKRAPQYEKPKGEVPHKFDKVVVEFFLKTTKGSLKDAQGNVLVDNLDPLAGEEDPFIPNPFDTTWDLAHSKKSGAEANLGKTITAAAVATTEHVHEMEQTTKKAFEILEAFFAEHNFKFIDYKIEFGITHDGRLVIADVIDNDSWRLRDSNWNDVSKQSFRDGEELSKIEDKYALVAKLFIW